MIPSNVADLIFYFHKAKPPPVAVNKQMGSSSKLMIESFAIRSPPSFQEDEIHVNSQPYSLCVRKSPEVFDKRL